MNKQALRSLADYCENDDGFNFQSIAYCCVPAAYDCFELMRPVEGITWTNWPQCIAEIAQHLQITPEQAENLFNPFDKFPMDTGFEDHLTDENAIEALRHFADYDGENMWKIIYDEEC